MNHKITDVRSYCSVIYRSLIYRAVFCRSNRCSKFAGFALTFLALAAISAGPSTVGAEELDAIFKRVNELVAARNFPKALDELNWARKEIEKQNMQQLQAFLPDEVSGFKGAKLDYNNAMGIMNMERTYTKDGATKITASITGSAGGGGAAAGLGGMAAIGQMAALMGGSVPGQDTLRIGGRTALLESNEDSGASSLTVFLDGGMILKLDQSSKGDPAVLKSFAESLKLDELEKYLKGS